MGVVEKPNAKNITTFAQQKILCEYVLQDLFNLGISKVTMYKGKNLGFSLLELMLAITLGSVLLVDIEQIFVKFNSELIKQQNLMQMMNQVRFIKYVLTNQLHSGAKLICGEKNKFVVMQKIFFHQHWQRIPVAYYLTQKKFYQKPKGGRAKQLANHILKMDIRYGVSDNLGNISRYVSAQALTKKELIKSLFITFTFQFMNSVWPVYIRLKKLS
jgi:prepilin-type N-terminal cleavage/methylation domain-containing protein